MLGIETPSEGVLAPSDCEGVGVSMIGSIGVSGSDVNGRMDCGDKVIMSPSEEDVGVSSSTISNLVASGGMGT